MIEVRDATFEINNTMVGINCMANKAGAFILPGDSIRHGGIFQVLKKLVGKRNTIAFLDQNARCVVLMLSGSKLNELKECPDITPDFILCMTDPVPTVCPPGYLTCSGECVSHA